MEAVIRVKPDELKATLIDMLKHLVKDNKNLEIIIQVKERSNELVLNEPPSEYLSTLNKSIEERLSGKTVPFTMDEFEKYVKENFAE